MFSCRKLLTSTLSCMVVLPDEGAEAQGGRHRLGLFDLDAETFVGESPEKLLQRRHREALPAIWVGLTFIAD